MGVFISRALTSSILVCLGLSGCSNPDFSGGSGAKYIKKTDKPKIPTDPSNPGGPGPGDGTPANPNGLEVDSNGNALIVPKSCDINSISFVQNEGRCADGSAAYAIDDNKAVYIACCPLPASDILATGAVATTRATCFSGEIAVGASGGGLMCMPINSARYKLAPPKLPCYLGSGAAGGIGSAKCGAPTATIQAMTAKFGTDACVPQPFGSLVTARTGKNCVDTLGAELLFKDTGLPVTMFK